MKTAGVKRSINPAIPFDFFSVVSFLSSVSIFSSFLPAFINFLCNGFAMNGNKTSDKQIPIVITHAIPAKTAGSVTSTAVPPVWPRPSIAFSAAVVSYIRLPITESLTHGITNPNDGARAITVARIDNADGIVKSALDVIALVNFFLSRPKILPCFNAFTRKNIDCARTKRITPPAIKYKPVLSLKSISFIS